MNLILSLFDIINVIILMSFSWNAFFYKYEMVSNICMLIVSMILFTISTKKMTKKQFLLRILCIINSIFLISTSVYSLNISETFMNAFEIFAITIYAINISKFYNKEKVYRILRKYFIVSIILSLVMHIMFPSKSMMYYQGKMVLKGVFAHKNVLARTMVISALLFLYEIFYSNKKLINLMFMMLSIYLIFISHSTTGILYVSIFSIVSILIYNNKMESKMLRNLTYIFIIFFNIFIFISSNPKFYEILSKINIMGKNLTFTGRNIIWSYVFDNIHDKIFLGYGYTSFWNSYFLDIFTIKYKFSPPHSHNGYIDIMLDGGVILLFLIISIIAVSINKNLDKFKINKISLVLLCVISLINLTESTLVGVFWFIIVVNCCYDRTQLTVN